MVTCPHRSRESPHLLPALTAIYLCLPLILFIWHWVRLRVSLVSLFFLLGVILIALFEAALALKIWAAGRASEEGFTWQSVLRLVAPALIALTAWLLISGAGGAGPQTFDTAKSNALLKDLIRGDWPLMLKFEGVSEPVVYYLGYYLLPAWVGKVLGWSAANIFVSFWVFSGVLLAFAWFVKISTVELRNRASRLFLLAAIFILAGGLDVIGYYVLKHNALNLGAHIEWWAWRDYLQYSSNSTLLFWVPQHSLPAWLLMGLAASCILEIQNLKYLGMALAASLIWSPFATLGVLPFMPAIAIIYLRKENRASAFNPLNIICSLGAAWVGSVVLLYITSNRFNFTKGFMWEFSQEPGRLATTLIQFWTLEVGLLTVLVLLLLIPGLSGFRQVSAGQKRSGLDNLRSHWQQNFQIQPRLVLLFLISAATLAVLPIYKFGELSDLLMRASIPSLFLLWAVCSKLILDSSPSIRRRRSLEFGLVLLVLIAGFYTASADIANRAINYSWGPPEWSSVKKSQVVEAMNLVQQRLGDPQSLFYRYLSK
jgi:hypothetical protein